MSQSVDTLGDALPREIARVRDEVLPAYHEIGQSGRFAVTMMRATLALAEKAMVDGDIVGMIEAYKSLKDFQT